jgi:pimeloyl-ACP methyl ester carboxylesterase
LLLHGSAETSACWNAILSHSDPSVIVERSEELVSPEAVIAHGATLAYGTHVVGHSYGGVLALILALERPEKVERLTLIEPVLFRVLEGRDETALAPVLETHRAFRNFDQGQVEPGLRALLDYWFGDGAWDRAPKGLRRLMFRDAQIIHDQIKHAASYAPPQERISALRVPTTLIAGSKSKASARSIVRILEGLFADVRRFEIEGARHDLIRSHPKELAERIGISARS